MTFLSFPSRFSALGGLLLAVLLAPAAAAQKTSVPPDFFTRYNYMAYVVHDTTSADPPTEVSGVGGWLVLRAAGTYEKRLSIMGNNGPMWFRQDGTFTLTGDSIRFAFSDLKGSDVQRGTFRFDPATRHLSITILGYPTGNRGVYELEAAPPPPPPPLLIVRPKAGRKTRR